MIVNIKTKSENYSYEEKFSLTKQEQAFREMNSLFVFHLRHLCGKEASLLLFIPIKSLIFGNN